MKIQFIPALLFVALALLCGCASSSNNNLKFTAYKESDVFNGKGGEENPVDGVDFWVSGEPDRKYRIIGILDMNHGQHGHHHGRLGGLFSSGDSSDEVEDTIAKAARKNGGDAVIVVHENQSTASSGSDTEDTESEHHRTPARYVVVKYIP